jgi:hypothetical protein
VALNPGAEADLGRHPGFPSFRLLAGGPGSLAERSAASEKIIVRAVATTMVPTETPFLDREAPLPPRSMPGPGLPAVLTAWFGGVVLVATCWLLDRPPILRQWFLSDVRAWYVDQWARVGVVGIGVSVVASFT